MKKRVGIVTQSTVRDFYKDKLELLLGEWFSFYECPLETLLFERALVEWDAVMFNVYSHYRMVSKNLSHCTEVIIIELTLSRTAYDTLQSVTKDTKVLYVNLNRAMSADSVLLFQNLGLTHIDYALYYPGKRSYPDIKTAVTNGESQFVPSTVEHIIDLGHREISPLTITELLTKLGRKDLLENPRIQRYFQTMTACECGLEFLLDRSSFMERQLDELMGLIKKGVIFADHEMNIIRTNGEEISCFGKSKNQIIGRKLYDIFEDLDLIALLQERQEVQNRLLETSGHYYSISIHNLRNKGEIVGTLLLIENFNQIERKQNSLKCQLLNTGYAPRYNIQSIVGDSPAMAEQRKMIHRFALSAVPVLVVGETGTGKEVAAQSIHNLSGRRENNFVAINCAAIPENLLESELFGYEPGAFTGALKVGKVGKFELANGGTLFLDEIGDIPLHLQGQLLRAIQEKEIVRLGGNKVTYVDCRIIAATNKDLFVLMQHKLFRADLYYRLNVLPLNLPSLRQHIEDIPPLIEHFRQQREYTFHLDAVALTFLLHYAWPGNVRELINCVDYFGSLFQSCITLSDVPAYMRRHTINTLPLAEISNADGRLPTTDSIIEHVILQTLLDAKHSCRRMGRRSLSQATIAPGLYITEGDMRAHLCRMATRGLIKITPGRGGTAITALGEHVLSQS